ncbi:Peptidase C1 and/or Propeptide C1 domain containing protein, partial [Asbolus verrucosus]
MLFLHISSAFLISFCTAQINVLSDEFIDSINKVQSFWKAGKVWPENTTREFLNRLSGSVDPKLFQHEHKGRILHPHQFRMRSDIPESFDLRHRWPQCTTIGKVRSQGYCGSCWALVPASVLTDRFCIASKGKVRFEFSAEDILTCCSRGCVSKRNNYCDGGRADKAWKFLIKEGGVSGGEYKSNEGCKPYPIEIFKADAVPGCRRACTNKNYPVPYSKDKRFVKYDTQIWTKSVSQIQTEIMDNGPVDAYMNVYKDFEVYRE